MPIWLELVLALASPIFAAGGAFAATKVRLEWHAKEIERAHQRLDAHDDMFIEQLRGSGL